MVLVMVEMMMSKQKDSYFRLVQLIDPLNSLALIETEKIEYSSHNICKICLDFKKELKISFFLVLLVKLYSLKSHLC
jgi:hypothetical protein